MTMILAPARVAAAGRSVGSRAVARGIGAAVARFAPGLGLCGAVSATAVLLAGAERFLFGAVLLEPLVLAIVVGAAVRSCWVPGPRWRPGVDAGARTVLEVAVVLLGASLSARTALAVGPAMLCGIAGAVAAAIAGAYGLGRLFGLERRMAILVACGNAICGNSAIAAVAPVIEAEGEAVSAAIGFTALLGIGLVLLLPSLPPLLGLTTRQYGALAGLTVYAVPQVLAATGPAGAAAVQVGTVVKLLRVLMLGPVVAVLAVLERRRTGVRSRTVPAHRLLPPFIVGFLVLAAARSGGLLPHVLLPVAAKAASLLTVLSMAGLGLLTDLRGAVRAGGRVSAVAALSLLGLGLVSLELVRWCCPA